MGAYTTALLSQHYGVPPLLNFPIAMIITAILAYLISFIVLRTYEDYFVVVTLGIQIIIYSLMNNLTDITNGPLGIVGIESFSFLPNNLSFMLFSIGIASSIYYILYNFSKSHYALNLKGIKEDEIYMKSLGKDVKKMKIEVFVISASIASIAGVLYAHYISYIDPTSFTVDESIYILSIVIIGGLGSLRGAFLASAFMVLLPEILRFVGLPDNIAANMRQIIYGLILIGVILWQEKRVK
ncbi:MAG: branched-chain amino acid ABC transporter permease [Campylobacterota bacterium]|nr:branched-chain amino acid ABC transporter permease [Campylobacterota bacterium]